jgi:hypothetical protein
MGAISALQQDKDEVNFMLWLKSRFCGTHKNISKKARSNPG